MLNKILGVALFFYFASFSEAKVMLKRSTEVSAEASAAASTASLSNCYEGFDPADQLEEMNLPEMSAIKEEAGIRIYHLKATVACQYSYSTPAIRYEYRPQTDVAVRTEFARKIAGFLKSFPKDFLQSFSGTRFVLVGGLINESSDHESDAVTNRKTIYIKTSTLQSVIAHEFMHVYDFINTEVSAESISNTDWYQDSPSNQCSYTNSGGEPLNFLARTFNQCFVSAYAQSNNLEDRAEIFKGLTEDHAGMVELSEQPGSGLLAVKIAALKAELRETSDNLNEQFWTARLKGNFYGSYEVCSGTPRTCRIQNFPAQHADWIDD